MAKHYLTKDGLEKLQRELADLKENKMPVVIERIARARELGDLSENAEYQDAKDEQGFLVGKISELEQMINKSEIIEQNGKIDMVSIGCKVKVRCGDQVNEYTIVGSNEADPAMGLISNESPLARAFLGMKKGDTGVIRAPRGEMECEILEIS